MTKKDLILAITLSIGVLLVMFLPINLAKAQNRNKYLELGDMHLQLSTKAFSVQGQTAQALCAIAAFLGAIAEGKIND